MIAQRFYKIRNAAVLLRLTQNQVYNLVKNNEIKSSGTHPVKVSLSSIQKYLVRKIPMLIWYLHDNPNFKAHFKTH